MAIRHEKKDTNSRAALVLLAVPALRVAAAGRAAYAYTGNLVIVVHHNGNIVTANIRYRSSLVSSFHKLCV